MYNLKKTPIILGMLAATAMPLQAQQEQQEQTKDDPWITGLKEGKVLADIRVRYEQVDDDVNDKAKGLTVRTRLGYETASMAGFIVLGEFTNTSTLGLDNYSPEKAGYATIADPTGTDVNRISLRYVGFENTDLGLGRQRINLDNQRWVGNVGWRQKEQTFDALSVDYGALGGDLKISYDYMTRVNGITESFDHRASNHVANVAYSGWDVGTLVGYAYFLNNQTTEEKNNTVGARFSGGIQSGDLKWLYTAELARQKYDPDIGSSATADYLSLEGGLNVGVMQFKLGYEILGSDGGDYGLQTPLATKHKFNGWADKFLGTPDGGLRDLYAGVFATLAGVKFGGYYHDFRADDGGNKYGRELDLVASKTFAKYYTVGAKYANYKADDFSNDTQKFWLWFNFKY